MACRTLALVRFCKSPLRSRFRPGAWHLGTISRKLARGPRCHHRDGYPGRGARHCLHRRGPQSRTVRDSTLLDQRLFGTWAHAGSHSWRNGAWSNTPSPRKRRVRLGDFANNPLMSSIKRDVKKKVLPRPEAEKILVSKFSPLSVSAPDFARGVLLWLVCPSCGFHLSVVTTPIES